MASKDISYPVNVPSDTSLKVIPSLPPPLLGSITVSYHLLPGVAFREKKNSSCPVMTHTPELSKYFYILPSFCPDHYTGSGQRRWSTFVESHIQWPNCLSEQCGPGQGKGESESFWSQCFMRLFQHSAIPDDCEWQSTWKTIKTLSIILLFTGCCMIFKLQMDWKAETLIPVSGQLADWTRTATS